MSPRSSAQPWTSDGCNAPLFIHGAHLYWQHSLTILNTDFGGRNYSLLSIYVTRLNAWRAYTIWDGYLGTSNLVKGATCPQAFMPQCSMLGGLYTVQDKYPGKTNFDKGNNSPLSICTTRLNAWRVVHHLGWISLEYQLLGKERLALEHLHHKVQCLESCIFRDRYPENTDSPQECQVLQPGS